MSIPQNFQGTFFCRGREQGGKYRMKLVNGFHVRKITVGLNEPLSPAAEVLAADFQVRVKNFDCTCALQLHELMG